MQGQTKVKDLMVKDVVVIPSDSTLKQAAERMRSVECGVLPVGKTDKPEGIITDRDIVLSAVAEGKDSSQEKVKDHMTTRIFFCNEDDSLEQAAEKMHEHQVNRLMVKDQSGKFSGIISFGRILRRDADAKELARVVEKAIGKKAA